MKIIKNFRKSVLAAIIVFAALSAAAQTSPPTGDADKAAAENIDRMNEALMRRPVAGSSRAGNDPVLFLVGNSTMRNGTKGNGENGQWGWGFYAAEFFDPAKITVENHALGGTSSRTFYNLLWKDVLAGVRPGDWVLIELGHNDTGPYDSGRARASLPGTGKDSLKVTIEATGKQETVYSYGEYLRRFVRETRAKGANPVLLTLTPRNAWNDAGRIIRPDSTFNLWVKQVAEQERVPLIDLNDIAARKYEKFGVYKTNYMFYGDNIHTSSFGARVNAKSAIEGLRAQPSLGLNEFLKPAPKTAGAARKPGKPVIFVIGDSTVKNTDSDSAGMWGWGSVLTELINPAKAVVDNQAMAGRSSRTFINEGRWDAVYDALQPGDVVFIQFGHNDSGDITTGRARGVLPGVGSENRIMFPETTRRYEVIYTYGWYIRKYIGDALEKGAIPIILSPVPRNQWTQGGKVVRIADTYGLWAAEVARETGVHFVDLNEISAEKLEKTGREAAAEYFRNDNTHSSLKGARLNAASVREGTESLGDPRLDFFK